MPKSMIYCLPFMVVAFFFGIISTTGWCADRKPFLQNDEVTVIYDELLQSGAEDLIGFYPQVTHELEEAFGWEFYLRPTVILLRRAEFKQAAGHESFVAFAVPDKNLIVIDHSRMTTHPFSLRITLKHELCHLLLHHYIYAESLPKWLDEGVCQWVSDGIAEIVMDYRRPLLKPALAGGELYRLDSLAERFPVDQDSLALAYAESKSIVGYINRQYGRDGLLRLLNSLKEGSSAETAFESNFSVTLDQLESNWIDDLQQGLHWWTVVAAHMYSVIFFLGAVVLVIGFIIRMVRRRKAYENLGDGWE